MNESSIDIIRNIIAWSSCLRKKNGFNLSKAYFVMDCESAERAFELARELPDFNVIAVEVCPIHT